MTEPLKIDRSTLVPIGVVVAVIAVLFSAWGFFNSHFIAIDLRFDGVSDALNKQDRRLEKLEEDKECQWTATEQKLWVSEFRRLNPAIEVPK